MKTYIALLRGINVGGKNRLPMKDLVAILEGLGLKDVATYVQSGNAVFRAKKLSTASLADKVSAAIKKKKGFEPRVLILELAALEKAMKGNPFPEAEDDPKSLHLGFLGAAPRKPDLAALENIKAQRERFQLKGSVFYLHAPDGVGRSKLAANAERLLGVPLTDRNWRTVCKVADLAEGVG